MKFTNISKFIIKFMGGGKINFPFNYLKEVEINGDNDGESGGNENSGGFDLDTFKQNIVDTYNKIAEASITKDNIVMPDAFIIDKNFSRDNDRPPISLSDTDLTQFLASYLLNVNNVYPLYLKDTLIDNDSNNYFGFIDNTIYFDHYGEFQRVENFDNMPDNAYDGNLDLSNYVYLYGSDLV